jgi:ComEC/Rec2-related protein
MRGDWLALNAVFLAAALIAGEALAFALPGFAGLWGWTALMTGLIICVAVGWRLPYSWYVIVFVAGAALAWRSEAARQSLDEYAKSLSEQGEAPVFVLKVEGDADCRINKRGQRIVSFFSRMGNIPLKVVSPLPEESARPLDGELWRCGGWLSLRKNAPNRYSRRTLWMTSGSPPVKVADAGAKSARAFYGRLSRFLSSRVGAGARWSKEITSLVNAMLLNRREGIAYGRLSTFAIAGTIHVFAISGLHVMLIAGLLNKIMKTMRFSGRARSAFSIPVLVAYVMLIGAPASAVRAVVMTSLYYGAYLFGRKPDSLAAWGVAAIVICGICPHMILDVGCVLSLSVMLGILLWIRWSRRFASPADGILMLAEREEAFRCRKNKRILLRIYDKSSWLLGSLGISFAAWIAGTPIAAIVFGRLTLAGLFVNIAIVPLATMAVAFGVAGLMLSLILPQLGLLFNNLSALCVFAMSWISEQTAGIPCSSVETMPWSIGDCLMWYAAWFALFALLSRHLPRKRYFTVKDWE